MTRVVQIFILLGFGWDGRSLQVDCSPRAQCRYCSRLTLGRDERRKRGKAGRRAVQVIRPPRPSSRYDLPSLGSTGSLEVYLVFGSVFLIIPCSTQGCSRNTGTLPSGEGPSGARSPSPCLSLGGTSGRRVGKHCRTVRGAAEVEGLVLPLERLPPASRSGVVRVVWTFL